jgi:signal transduction histidine kinase
VQEGLINALRHAQATHVEINLESRFDDDPVDAAASAHATPRTRAVTRDGASSEQSPQRMIVTVTDDGVGLPAPGSWSRPGHFGLRGLTERVEHLGGQLSIRNRDPHGVSLTAEIPLFSAKIPTAVGT